SSRIRSEIKSGNIELAAKLLGRPYRTRGKVIRGASRGKGLGFPTANLERVPTMIPARGVYATRVTIGAKKFLGATNVGIRPTIDPTATEVVETHLLDFSGDLVGFEIEIEWLTRLRDEKKFSSAEELSKQIQNDLTAVRNLNA